MREPVNYFMNLNLEWNKIVINAMSVFVAAIILGAAGIVWERAMSVDEKVRNSAASINHLVDSLSDKLASYEVQLAAQSNQLAAVIKNQTDLIAATRNQTSPTLGNLLLPTPVAPVREDKANTQLRTKAQALDIRQQLQYAK